MDLERRRVTYRGRVQGVGFRATTRRLAAGFAVAGFVRNLDDGRVELVAEGAPSELDAFQDAIAREFGGKIHGATAEPAPRDDDLGDAFTIRY